MSRRTRTPFGEIERTASAGRDPRELLPAPSTKAGRELAEAAATVWGARVAVAEAEHAAANLPREADAIDRRAARDAVEAARLRLAEVVRKVRPAAARAANAIGQQRRALVAGGERDAMSAELRELRREGALRDILAADPADRADMLESDIAAEAVCCASPAVVRRLAIPGLDVEQLKEALAQRRDPEAFAAVEEGRHAAQLLQNELRAAATAGGVDWVEQQAEGEAAN